MIIIPPPPDMIVELRRRIPEAADEQWRCVRALDRAIAAEEEEARALGAALGHVVERR